MKIAIVGMGEVGRTIKSLINESGQNHEIIEVDIDRQPEVDSRVDIMHICFHMKSQDEFINEVLRYLKKYNPKLTIIESTILPGTCRQIVNHATNVLLVHSPVRGQHNKLSEDMKHYTKWVSSNTPEALKLADEYYRSLGLNTKAVENFEITELSKLLDTTQYGILISWAQEAERICRQFDVDYSHVREFGKETHKLYGVRPDIFPGFVGGNCIRQNIALLRRIFKSKFFDTFIESNKLKMKELGIEDEVDYG